MRPLSRIFCVADHIVTAATHRRLSMFSSSKAYKRVWTNFFCCSLHLYPSFLLVSFKSYFRPSSKFCSADCCRCQRHLFFCSTLPTKWNGELYSYLFVYYHNVLIPRQTYNYLFSCVIYVTGCSWHPLTPRNVVFGINSWFGWILRVTTIPIEQIRAFDKFHLPDTWL